MKDEYDDGMLPEYDFSGPNVIRGKYADIKPENTSIRVTKKNGDVVTYPYLAKEGVILLDEDVQEYFSDNVTVNNTLRALIALLPKTEARKGA